MTPVKCYIKNNKKKNPRYADKEYVGSWYSFELGMAYIIESFY